MIKVMLSLIPALAVMTFFFGSGTLIQFIISAATALICQAVVAFLRSRPIKRALKDPSGVVTAMLLALTLPQLLPWYLTVMATVFAMIIVRECFGGLGMNLFNPAMSGFIFLVISTPSVFYSTWVSPTPYAVTVATPARAYDVIFNGADPQILIKEIKSLNRKNETEFTATLIGAKAENGAAADASKADDAKNANAAANESKDQANAFASGVADEANDSNKADVSDHQEFGADAKRAADSESAKLLTDGNIDEVTSDLSTADAEAAHTVNTAGTSVSDQDKATYDKSLSEASITFADRLTTDALTGATFLESIKTSRKAGTVETLLAIDFQSPSFMGYAALAIAYFIGGLYLIFAHIIRFQVPLAFLAAVAAVGAIWHHYDPTLSINTVEHLIMGGTMLGAFYIITDPVTTCGTFKGRILLSAFIGILVVVLRINGSYSDSVAFAVMLGNCLAPLMDVLTKRRPFGVGYRPGGLS